MAVDHDALRTHLSHAHAIAHDRDMPDDDAKADAIAGHMKACHYALAEKSPFSDDDDDDDEEKMKVQKSEFRDEVFALTGASDDAKALGSLAAMKAKAEQVEMLSAKVAELEAAQRKGEIAQLLDEAVKDGRLAPAKRAEVERLSDKYGIDCAKEFVAALPRKVEPAQPPAEKVKVSGILLSDEQKKILALTGTSPEEYAKYREEYHRQFADRGLRTVQDKE
jgi:phage I-like protein